MKTYEDLTKAEKEKLHTYLQYISFLNTSTIMVILFGLLIFLTGYALIFVFIIPVVMIVGMFFIMVGIVLVFFALINNITDKKHLFLIFGYKSMFSDIFDIKKKDIKKVKIIREVKWVKEE